MSPGSSARLPLFFGCSRSCPPRSRSSSTCLGSRPSGDVPNSFGFVPPIYLPLAVLGSTIVAIVGPMAYFIPWLIRVQDALRIYVGSEVLGTHAAGWRLGGVIYFAPKDPALFVPKKIVSARPSTWHDRPHGCCLAYSSRRRALWRGYLQSTECWSLPG